MTADGVLISVSVFIVGGIATFLLKEIVGKLITTGIQLIAKVQLLETKLDATIKVTNDFVGIAGKVEKLNKDLNAAFVIIKDKKRFPELEP